MLGSWKNQSESWKSPGNLFLKKGMNPELLLQVQMEKYKEKIQLKLHYKFLLIIKLLILEF